MPWVPDPKSIGFGEVYVEGIYGDTLTYDQAMQIVNDMLLVCQKLSSNFAETMHAAKFGEEEIEEYMKYEMDWLHGEKNIVPLLIDLSQGLKPLEGIGIMNLMHIAHRSMNGLIAVIAPLRLPDDRELPEPRLAWATLGRIEKE